MLKTVKMVFFSLCLMLSLSLLASKVEAAPKDQPVVKIETNMGNIVVELDESKAPLTTQNFLKYVESGHYEGTIFHRVIRDFMIQGGGLTSDMKDKPTRAPIKNEANNGLHNRKYTIAMARTSDPHSATAQFFINTANNSNLDYRGSNEQDWGYAVFGRVISGKEVVDKIERVATTSRGMHKDVPISPIVIRKISIMPRKR